MLIIILVVLSLIQSPLSARTCKKSLDFSHIRNIELFYQQDHPECLKGHFEKTYNLKFKSFEAWSEMNERMKVLKLQPENWQDFESIQSLFFKSNSRKISKNLRSLDQMSPKRKAKLSAWLSSQKKLVKSLKELEKSKVVSRELAKAFPFIW